MKPRILAPLTRRHELLESRQMMSGEPVEVTVAAFTSSDSLCKLSTTRPLALTAATSPVAATSVETLFANWGGSGEGDLNNDGIVDAADAAELFATWDKPNAPTPRMGLLYIDGTLTEEPTISASQLFLQQARMARTSTTGTCDPSIVPLSDVEQHLIELRATSFLTDYISPSLTTTSELSFLSATRISQDTSAAVFQQYHQGIPVYGATANVILDADFTPYFLSGHYFSPDLLNISSVSNVSEAVAHNTARSFVSAMHSAQRTTSDTLIEHIASSLYLYNREFMRGNANVQGKDFALVYVTTVEVTDKYSDTVLVDAISGNILDVLESDAHAEPFTTVYDCSVSGCPLAQPETEPNPVYGGTDVKDIYTFTTEMLAYLSNEFGRNGANGDGGIGTGFLSSGDGAPNENRFRAYVSDIGCRTAVYSFPPRQISFCPGVVVRDLFGHEYFHAMADTMHSRYGLVPALLLQGESGTINEALADAFGEDFASYYDLSSFDWIFGTNLSSFANRSLASPEYYSYRPTGVSNRIPMADRYTSENFYCGSEDNGGVHWNSGTVSKAVFLASVGTIGYGLPADRFNGVQVSGIGLYKVTQVLYYTLQHATTIMNFNELYNAVDASCSLFVGAASNKYSVNASDCTQIRLAMQATELDFPSFGNCQPDRYVPTSAVQELPGDFNRDQNVDQQDLRICTANLGKTVPSGTPFRLSCDANEDGTVTSDDYATFGHVSDLNGDGVVDAGDAGQMFSVWDQRDYFADLNIDHIVDAADAGIMFAEWTG